MEGLLSTIELQMCKVTGYIMKVSTDQAKHNFMLSLAYVMHEMQGNLLVQHDMNNFI